MAKRLRIVPLLAMFIAAIFALSGCSGSSGDHITSGTIKGQVAIQDGGGAGGIVVVAEQLTEGMTATAARVAGRAAAKVGDTFTAVTAEDGSFELTGLPLGKYSLYAERGDLIGQTTVTLSGELAEAVLSLTPGAVISGSVIFKDLDGNNVSVSGAVAVIDGTSFTTEVSSGGSYTFTKVPRGSYAGITVMAEGFNDAHIGAFTVDSSSYTAPTATVFSLEGAAVRRTVAGVVISAVDQQPIAGALVSLDGEQTTVTSENGTYFFPSVTAGEHVITVTAPGFGAGYTEIVVKPVERLNTWSVSFPDTIDSAADLIAELLSEDIQFNYGDQGGDNIVSADVSGDNTQSTNQDEDDSGSPATYADYINYLIATLPVDVTQAGTVNFLLAKSDGGIKGQVVVDRGGATVPAAGATVKVYRVYDADWDVTNANALDNDQGWGDFDDTGHNHDQDINDFDGAVEWANSSDIEDTSSVYPYRVLVAETTTDESGYYSVELVSGLSYRVEVYYDTDADLFAGYHMHHDQIAVHSGDMVTKNFVLIDDLRPYVVSVTAGDNMLMNEGTLWADSENGGFDGAISITFNEPMNTSYALLADVELVVRDYNPGGIENTPNEGNFHPDEVTGTDNFGDVDNGVWNPGEENARNGHVPAAFTWSADGKTLTITPAEALPAGYTYQVINLSNLEDLAGNSYTGEKQELATDGIASSLDTTDDDSVETDLDNLRHWDYLGSATHDRFFDHPTLEFEVRSEDPEFPDPPENLVHVPFSSDSDDGNFAIEFETVDGAVAYNVYATLGDPMMKVYIGTVGGEKFIGLEDTLRFSGSLTVINGALAADGQPTLDDIYNNASPGDWGAKQLKIGVTAVNKDRLEGSANWVVVHDNIGPYIVAVDGDHGVVQLGNDAPYTLAQGTPINGTNFNAWDPRAPGAYYLRTSVLRDGSFFVFQENLKEDEGTITFVNGYQPMPEGYGGFDFTNEDDGELTTVKRSSFDPRVVRYEFSNIELVDTGDYLEITYQDRWGNTTVAPVFLVDDIEPYVVAATKDTENKTITVTLSEPVDPSTVATWDAQNEQWDSNFTFTWEDADKDDNGDGPLDKKVAPTVSEDGKSVTFSYTRDIKGKVTVSAKAEVLDLSGNAADSGKSAEIADDRGPAIAWAAARLNGDLYSTWIFFDEALENEEAATTAREEDTGKVVEVFQYQLATYTFTCGDQVRVVKWTDECTDDCEENGWTANGVIDPGEAEVTDGQGNGVGIYLSAITYTASGGPDDEPAIKLSFEDEEGNPSPFFFADADCECTVSVDYVVDDAGNSNDPTQSVTIEVNDDMVGPDVASVEYGAWNGDYFVENSADNGYSYNAIRIELSELVVHSSAETAVYTFTIGGQTYEAKWVDGGDGKFQSDESELLSAAPIVADAGDTTKVVLVFKNRYFFAPVAPGDTLLVTGVIDLVGNTCSQLPFDLSDTLPPTITGITATEGTQYDTIVLQLSEALSATSQQYVTDPSLYTVKIDDDTVFVVGTPVYDADNLTLTVNVPKGALSFTNGVSDDVIDVEIASTVASDFVLEDARDNRSGSTVSTPDLWGPEASVAIGNAMYDDPKPAFDAADMIQMGVTDVQKFTVVFTESVLTNLVTDPAGWTLPDGWSIVNIETSDADANNNNNGVETNLTDFVTVEVNITTPTQTGDQIVLDANHVVDEAGNAMASDFVIEVGTTPYDVTPPYITNIAWGAGDDVSDWLVLTVSEALATDSTGTDTVELEPDAFDPGGLGSVRKDDWGNPVPIEQVAAPKYDPNTLTITLFLEKGAKDAFEENCGGAASLKVKASDVNGNVWLADVNGNQLASIYPFGGMWRDAAGSDRYSSADDALGNGSDDDTNGTDDDAEQSFDIDMSDKIPPRIYAHNFNTALNGTYSDGDPRIFAVTLYFCKALDETTAEDPNNYDLSGIQGGTYSLYVDPVYEDNSATGPGFQTQPSSPDTGSTPEEYKSSGKLDTKYRVTLWMYGDQNIETTDSFVVETGITDLYGNNLVDPTITASDKTPPIMTNLAISGLDLVDVGTHYDELTLTVNEALAGPLQAGDLLAYIANNNDEGTPDDTSDDSPDMQGTLEVLPLLGDPALSSDGTTVVLKVIDSDPAHDLTNLPTDKWVVVQPTAAVTDAAGNPMDPTGWAAKRGTFEAPATVVDHSFDYNPAAPLGGGIEEGESTVAMFTVQVDPGAHDSELESVLENPANWSFDPSDTDTIERFTNPQYDDNTNTVTVWIKITRGLGGDGIVNAEDTCTITSSIFDGGSVTIAGGDHMGPRLVQLLSVESADDVAYNVRVLVSEDIDVDQLDPSDITVTVTQGSAPTQVDVIGLAYDDTSNVLSFKIPKIQDGTAIEIDTVNGQNETVEVDWTAGLPIGLDGDAAGDTDPPYETTEETVAGAVSSSFGENDITPPYIKAGSVTGWFAGAGDTDGDPTTPELIGVTFILKDDQNLVDDTADGPLPIDANVLAALTDWDNYSASTANGAIGGYGTADAPVVEGSPVIPVHPIATPTADNTEVLVTLWFAYDPAAAGGLAVGDSFTLSGTASIVDAWGNTITLDDAIDGINTVYAESGGYSIDNPRLESANDVLNDAFSGINFNVSPWENASGAATVSFAIDWNEALFTAGLGGTYDSFDALNPVLYELDPDGAGALTAVNPDTFGPDGVDDSGGNDDVDDVSLSNGNTTVALNFSDHLAGLAKPRLGQATLSFPSADGTSGLRDVAIYPVEDLPRDGDIGLPKVPADWGVGSPAPSASTLTFDTVTLTNFVTTPALPEATDASVAAWSNGGVADGVTEALSLEISNAIDLGGTTNYVLWLFDVSGTSWTELDASQSTAAGVLTLSGSYDLDALAGNFRLVVSLGPSGAADPSAQSVVFVSDEITPGAAAQDLTDFDVVFSATHAATSTSVTQGGVYSYPANLTVSATVTTDPDSWTASNVGTLPPGYQLNLYADGAFSASLDADGTADAAAALTGASSFTAALEPVAADTTAGPSDAVARSW